jgi:uncharacterized phage protein gp47/JayE
MSFRRDSLAVLQNRIYANYASLFSPLGKTPRHNLLKVFASVDAGIYHQLLGDLDFLARQIFPDTAEGEYLREHWSAKVPPLYATTAGGEAEATGIPGRAVPSGVVFSAASGERYYSEKASRLDASGKATIAVKAQNPGAQANLPAGEKLSMASAVPPGVDSSAMVGGAGITGGSDAESDEEYLARVLAFLRNPVRYGKPGDYALWAKDSSAEVSAAWEFRSFGVFGAVLVMVIGGSQHAGVSAVGGLDAVRDYISQNAPPVPFEVRTPAIVPVSPEASLPDREDTVTNRDLAAGRMRAWMQQAARPGAQITAGALRLAAIDGVDITDMEVRLEGSTAGIVETTVLEYPCLGEMLWR